MEEKDIDQLIEELSKITREDGKETYAQAQFNLGCIYLEIKHDYDLAETYFSNITKDDNPELYANAQFKLGFIYQEIKHNYDLAEDFYLNVNKEDNPEAYAEAQLYLGYIYYQIKQDLIKAEVFYLNTTKEDNPNAYVQAQLNLGYIYHKIKLDFDNAEVFYSNITKEDNPEVYALAQFELGYIYHEIKHDFANAEAFYSNIAKEDNPEIYALAQLNLGYIYCFIKHDFDNAEAFYLNIIKEDNPEIYAKAQLYLGDIYYRIKNDFDNAKAFYLEISEKDSPNLYISAKFQLGKIYSSKNFKKYTEAKCCFIKAAKIATYSNCHPYYYICAQFILKLMQSNSSLISNEKKFAKLNETIFDKIENICNLTNYIKYNLLVFNSFDNNEQERHVSHYTKPAVLFNLLKGENPSKFRLNIVDFMNDPSENQILTSWLNISNNPDNEIKSFLASFSFNHNSLNQFRLYGNEDNIVGSGVSIAFNKNFFGLDTKRSINNEIISLHSIKSIKSFENKQVKLETEQIEIKSANTLYPLPLYRCLYFDPKTGYMALAKRNKQSFYLENKNEKTPETIDREWDDYINLLNESDKISKIRTKLEAIQKLIAELSNNPELKKISNLHELLSLAVLPISCLIKHAAFEDEDECRMIYITHIADDNIVEPQDYQSANSLYVEYTHVEEYIDNIYLGPQCKMQHKIWLQNHFKKKRREREIKLIKSEMPLR
ncbi:tetratricopeptide repeat protein [Snodgrassella alvi]|uniref:tetratricopeptide repeat protein n=1 Tax=Snodgrassella alvi TaxID=1196083 RepID=UPI00274041A6|nr:tetratricopeptide repeat protein [Snodgrassella alvi]WLT01616.1 tetratricopeptide repeat protein [Snodgrassella alvi]